MRSRTASGSGSGPSGSTRSPTTVSGTREVTTSRTPGQPARMARASSGRRSEHPLRLVDEHDDVAGLQGTDQARHAVVGGQRHARGDGKGRGQVLGVARLMPGQRHVHDVVVGRERRADVGEQPGLAHAPRAGDRDQPTSIAQGAEHAGHLGLATDRRRRRDRQAKSGVDPPTGRLRRRFGVPGEDARVHRGRFRPPGPMHFAYAGQSVSIVWQSAILGSPHCTK